MGDFKKAVEKLFPNESDVRKKPIASFVISFDSNQAQLEPIYFWLLDFIEDKGWKPKKIIDNFMSSPGSGHFADMGQRATRLQEEGMKILGGLNQVIKSSLNLVYDLKEFEIRLSHYDDAKSEDPKKAEEGLLALKQIWLDNVDIKKGRGAIHQMATTEMGFTTIREAFMMAKDEETLEKMNSEKGGVINDQVKRILIPRLSEFNKWRNYSEEELRKRMSIEKHYLKSQVETIKLYSGWLRPYLKSAEQLRQKGFDGHAALVNAFSTSMFQLTLLGKKDASVPGEFGDYKLRREYHSIIVVDMNYRGHVSQQVGQGGDTFFARGGKIEMTFDSYSLNSEEYKLVEKEMEAEEVSDVLNFDGDMAIGSLDALKKDLDHFLKTDEEKAEDKKKAEAEEKKKKGSQDINPFGVMFSGVKDLFKGDLFKGKNPFSLKKKDVEINEVKDIKSDNHIEKIVRVAASKDAAEGAYLVYNVYKKTHGMASSEEDFENFDESRLKDPEVKLKDVLKGFERN